MQIADNFYPVTCLTVKKQDACPQKSGNYRYHNEEMANLQVGLSSRNPTYVGSKAHKLMTLI
jgi:hypothetical protein